MNPTRCFAVLLVSFSTFTGLSPVLSPAFAQPIVTSLAPDAVPPGETVSVFGQDFGTQPEDLRLWVRTPDSGFALEVQSAEDEYLEAKPVTVPKAETGALQLWKGSRHKLHDHTLLTAGTLMTLHTGELFIAREKADGPLLSSIDSTPRAVGSKATAGGLAIDFMEFLSVHGDVSIAVVVTVSIETNGGRLADPPPSSNSTVTDDGDAASLAWAARFTIDSGPVSDPSQWVAGLAEMLNHQFGSLDIEASAEGESLLVASPHGIEGGFISLQF